MQQLVNRLDVAMFNAILRESAKDMPTDPVSDPISDSKVLPVQPGNASFGAGAQLKNIVSADIVLHAITYFLFSVSVSVSVVTICFLVCFTTCSHKILSYSHRNLHIS